MSRKFKGAFNIGCPFLRTVVGLKRLSISPWILLVGLEANASHVSMVMIALTALMILLVLLVPRLST